MKVPAEYNTNINVLQTIKEGIYAGQVTGITRVAKPDEFTPHFQNLFPKIQFNINLQSTRRIPTRYHNISTSTVP
jgi:hypothetical protein